MRAERTGGLSHRDIGKLLSMSHANVIIIEKRALAKMAKQARAEGMLCAELFETSARDIRTDEEGKTNA